MFHGAQVLSPLATIAKCSRSIPCVSCVHPHAMVELWLAQECMGALSQPGCGFWLQHSVRHLHAKSWCKILYNSMLYIYFGSVVFSHGDSTNVSVFFKLKRLFKIRCIIFQKMEHCIVLTTSLILRYMH